VSGREGMELRFHFGERDRDGRGGPLDLAVMDACARHGVCAAALLRGVEGFGAKHVERTDRLLSLSEDPPLVAVAVGDAGTIEGLAAELAGLTPTGPATTTAAEVAGPVGAPSADGAGDVVRATIWGPRSGSGAPHVTAVDALHRHGADAATVLLGVDGVLDGERRRARFVAANRGVPAITVAVGARGAIEAALAEVGDPANLVTIEGGAPKSGIDRLSRPGGSDDGARVTLVTSEIARGDAGPRYLEFVHALRREGAAGATALRGVWGFRGDVAPHGDRVLALRRDVPLIVETVDTAERAERWLELAQSLAGEADVVYSQRSLRIGSLD
jgi:PII-like signaling protein